MFAGFEEARDGKARKRWLASTGTSLLVYALVGVGLLVLARQTVAKVTEEPPIEVTFRSAPDTPEPPKVEAAPPPPTQKKPGPRPKRPGKVAPVQPRAIPSDRPDEADPTGDGIGDDVAIGEEFGDGEGDGSDRPPSPPPPAPPPPPPPPPAPPPPPVEERDDVVLPTPLPGNPLPTYPESARKSGEEGVVVLRVRISATGEVIDVEVERGKEPFVAAALAVVRGWRYRPALVDGKPAEFRRRVKIPFQLRA